MSTQVTTPEARRNAATHSSALPARHVGPSQVTSSASRRLDDRAGEHDAIQTGPVVVLMDRDAGGEPGPADDGKADASVEGDRV
jgi:hypothetical protein